MTQATMSTTCRLRRLAVDAELHGLETVPACLRACPSRGASNSSSRQSRPDVSHRGCRVKIDGGFNLRFSATAERISAGGDSELDGGFEAVSGTGDAPEVPLQRDGLAVSRASARWRSRTCSLGSPSHKMNRKLLIRDWAAVSLAARMNWAPATSSCRARATPASRAPPSRPGSGNIAAVKNTSRLI